MDIEYVYEIIVTLEHDTPQNKRDKYLRFSVLPEDVGDFVDLMKEIEEMKKDENWYKLSVCGITKTYTD